MGNNKDIFGHQRYSSPFTTTNYRRKHAYSQVNGETQMSQHNIILARETRKQS